MKNTKHTENLDNSTPQEITSQSKRKILTSIGVSSGILGASALSQQWTKPIVNSIILPAHAQSTPMMTTMMMTTMGMSTTKPAMDDMDMTTMMPEPATPSIILSKSVITLQEGGDATAAQMMETYTVRLGSMPEAEVTVTMAGQEAASDGAVTIDEQSLTFTKENYMTPQEVKVSVTNEADVSAGTAGDKTIRIIHSAFSYAPMVAVLTVTVVDQDVFKPALAALTVTGDNNLDVAQAVALSKAELGEGELAVFWTHDEKAETTGYEVQLQEGSGPRFVMVGTYPADARNTPVLTRKKGTAYTAKVIATYRDGSEVSADAAENETTGTAS